MRPVFARVTFVTIILFTLSSMTSTSSAESIRIGSIAAKHQTAAASIGALCSICCVGSVCIDNASVEECEAAGGFCALSTHETSSSETSSLCVPVSPCLLGACCRSGDTCDDNDGAGISEADCLQHPDGQYIGGARCADDICPSCDIESDDNCQRDTGNLIVQIDRAVWTPPDQVDRWADDFTPTVSGPMERICWYPAFFNPDFGAECSAPGEPPADDWQLRLYQDAGGYPGTEIGSAQSVDPDNKVSLGAASRIWLYSAPVLDPPMLEAGTCYWLEMTGAGQGPGGCRTYWALSGEGNSHSVNDQFNSYGPEDVITEIPVDPPDRNVDLAFCIPNGIDSCGVFTGACCTPDFACTDGASVESCDMAGGAWIVGESCDTPDVCPVACEAPTFEEAIDLNAPGSPCEFGLPCDVPFDTRFCDPETVELENCRNSSAITSVGRRIYFKYKAARHENGYATASSCSGTSYDGVTLVYAGCDAPDSLVDCANDTCGIGDGPSEATFTICRDVTYFIVIGGDQADSGPGTLHLSFSSSNNPPCSGSGGLAPPLANPVFNIAGITKSCTTDDDCALGETGPAPQTVCRHATGSGNDGSCYVARQRYLSIQPNPWNAGSSLAYRVSLDRGDEEPVVLGFVQEPQNVSAGANNGPSSYDRSTIDDIPYFRDWSQLDSGIVTIGDCEIVPGHRYLIQTVPQGANVDRECPYSSPLVLPTATHWGDVTGGGSPGDPPNGAPGSLVDVFASVLGFQSNGNEPLDWLDTDPATGAANPNLIVGLADSFSIVQAFQGYHYPGPAPLDCP